MVCSGSVHAICSADIQCGHAIKRLRFICFKSTFGALRGHGKFEIVAAIKSKEGNTMAQSRVFSGAAPTRGDASWWNGKATVGQRFALLLLVAGMATFPLMGVAKAGLVTGTSAHLTATDNFFPSVLIDESETV